MPAPRPTVCGAPTSRVNQAWQRQVLLALALLERRDKDFRPIGGPAGGRDTSVRGSPLDSEAVLWAVRFAADAVLANKTGR